MAGTLYIVGTPIGNLGDMSPRAAETLKSVDFIAAEDTRVTVKLLNRFDIKKPMLSYFEHNRTERGKDIAERLLSGESCALVSDAGMPAISDPGEQLVMDCHERGIPVSVIPGPSAAVSALAVSGQRTGRFTFEGFLSVSKKKRKEHLEEIKTEKRTMIFYEAPHKLRRTLEDLLETLGDRGVTIARELTKIYEEIIITTLSEACQRYSHPPKGEIVLIVEGATPDTVKEPYTLDEAVDVAREEMDVGLSASDAAKKAAAVSGIKKSEIYREMNK